MFNTELLPFNITKKETQTECLRTIAAFKSFHHLYPENNIQNQQYTLFEPEVLQTVSVVKLKFFQS